MTRQLPSRANLDHLKHEAKSILKAHRSGDSSVCTTLRHLPGLERASEAMLLAAKFPLQKVQHALAREYGFGNWKALVDHVAGGDGVEAEYARAYQVLCARGPERDSTGSEYEKRLHRERLRLVNGGAEGYQVIRRLARSDNGRARSAAVICLALHTDPGATVELARLLDDPAVSVRSRAVRFYASRIHPARTPEHLPHHWDRAATVPAGVDALLPLAADPSPKVALDAIRALSAYAHLGDGAIQRALTSALTDDRHRIAHHAARVLGRDCPGCGTSPRR